MLVLYIVLKKEKLTDQVDGVLFGEAHVKPVPGEGLEWVARGVDER